MNAAVHEARQRVIDLPCWSAPVDPQPLGGGLSNHNFVVEDNGQRYVVRIGGDHVLHNVMRFNEQACARAAAEVELTPAIVYAQANALVIDFVEGDTCSAQDVRDNLQRLMPLVRGIHEQVTRALRGPVLGFSPFHVVRHYAKCLDEGDSRMRSELARFVSITEEFEQVTGPSQTVLCHNDLLAANFIDSGDKIWIIDWEHAGFGSPLFDLANLASNNELNEADEQLVLEAYFEAPLTPALWRKFRAMRCVSHLREAMWSMVSELHSNIDFDFVAYSDENMVAFETALAEFRAL